MGLILQHPATVLRYFNQDSIQTAFIQSSQMIWVQSKFFVT